MSPSSAEIESIERATLAAVMPQEVLEIGGWLVGLDPGSIRRAASAVPLSHEISADPELLDQIEAAYATRGLSPAFRLGDGPGPAEHVIVFRGGKMVDIRCPKQGKKAGPRESGVKP